MALTTTINSLQVDGALDYALVPPTSIMVYVLAAGVERDIDLVADFIDSEGKRAKWMSFSSDANFYVKWGAFGAAVPTVDITTGLGVELNPSFRKINSIDTCSIVSPIDSVVTINLFQ